MSRSSRRRPQSDRRANTSFVAIGLIAGLVLIASASLMNSAPPLSSGPAGDATTGNGHASQSTLLRTGQACSGGGSQSTLADLEADKLPYPLLMPSTEVASVSNLASAWRCQGSEVELRFSSGVNIYLDLNTIDDPARAWEELASADPNDTSVGRALGQPAALIDPAKSKSANGSVSVVSGTTWVVVEGDGKLPLGDLIGVADSLKAIS